MGRHPWQGRSGPGPSAQLRLDRAARLDVETEIKRAREAGEDTRPLDLALKNLTAAIVVGRCDAKGGACSGAVSSTWCRECGAVLRACEAHGGSAAAVSRLDEHKAAEAK